MIERGIGFMFQKIHLLLKSLTPHEMKSEKRKVKRYISLGMLQITLTDLIQILKVST